MMNAIKLHIEVDETTAKAIPGLRPLLGKQVELIALETSSPAITRRLTLDEFLARRPEAPEGVGPVSIEDIDKAIIDGATKS
jgi:hypothetical protein